MVDRGSLNHQSVFALKDISAERGEYEPQFEEVDLYQMLQELCDLYRHHERVTGRLVELAPNETCLVRTDPPVLRRIVGNMVLNGMEAAAKGKAGFDKNGNIN